MVVADEIHNDLIMPGYEHTVYATVSEEMAQNCIVCTSPSKTFNMAGMMTSNIIVPNPELKQKVYDYRESQAVFFCNMAGYKAVRSHTMTARTGWKNYFLSWTTTVG